jgi:hypothetical protein
MGRWKMAVVVFLLLNGFDSARAEGPSAATSPSRTTRELEDPSPKSPPSVERASRPESDSPVTGASRR